MTLSGGGWGDWPSFAGASTSAEATADRSAGKGGWGGCTGFGGSIGSILIVGSSAVGSAPRSPNEVLREGAEGSDAVGAGAGGWIGSGEGSGELDSDGRVRSPKLVF